jgi:serine/threonine protein kinase
MQFVFGESLKQRLERTGCLQLTDVVRIGMEVASRLAAAHEKGLIHRDIKPSNILLEDGTERVKITDFGLARATDDTVLTHSGVLVGTPEYIWLRSRPEVKP